MISASKALPGRPYQEQSIWQRIPQVERRQWWLSACAIVVTLLLTTGTASFSFLFQGADPQFSENLRESIRGLVGLVFLFDVYIIYQQLQIHRFRKQLTDQQEMFRLITENVDDLITVIDRNGERLYDSPGYHKIFGYSKEDLRGRPVVDQIHPDDHEAILAAGAEVFQKGVGPRVEYRLRRKDGEWRVLESNGSPVRNYRGEIEKIVVVNRDITERKQAEELLRQREDQLRQSQKMEAVGRLSGGIAHDFNNLLGVIIGYSEVMESSLVEGHPLRKNAEQIRKAGERAAALTRRLLAFSRQQALQPKILDLNVLVTDMGQMLRRLIGAHINLTTKLASDLAQVKADQSQIEQVIVNLAVNARDAMPEGGNLLIETSTVYVNETLAKGLPFLQPGPHVLLTVSDTGVGMDAETQRHIFEPFFTTKEQGKGTGLGLATVYGVVKQSGGVVGVHSEPGAGSTFRIYLPQAEEILTTPAHGTNANQFCKRTETVLVVEDEDALLRLTCDLLVENGYTVLSAHDGVQALELARSYDKPIHLLLTDVVMPRLGGPSLAQSIAHLRPETHILFMTGHAERDPILQGAFPPGTDVLQKPFHREALLQKVHQILDVAELQAR